MKLIQKPTPNYYPLWSKPTVLVLHVTAGVYEGAVEWLTTSPEERLKQTGTKSYSSAHFVLDRNSDEIAQLAPVTVGTWHAGVIIRPTARALKVLPKTIFGKLKNPNRGSIGIEVAAGYDANNNGIVEATEKMYTQKEIQDCAELILEVIEPQTGITYDDAHIITHRDIDAQKPNLEVSRLMLLSELAKRRAKKIAPPTPPIPTTPTTQTKVEQIRVHAEEIIKLTN